MCSMVLKRYEARLLTGDAVKGTQVRSLPMEQITLLARVSRKVIRLLYTESDTGSILSWGTIRDR